VTLAAAVPEIVGALLPSGVAPTGWPGVTGVTGVSADACAEGVEGEPEPPPPQAASIEDRTTEQQAIRSHEPAKVLILCDPIK
jgi:hypothetical protein